MILEDGHGTGTKAKIDEEGKLKTYSITEIEAAHTSNDHGLLYSWSHAYNYDAGDTILLLRNNNTDKKLIIERIIISGDTTTQVTLHSPTDTTLAGTDLTGVNANRSSGNVALASAIGDETGNTQANIITTAFLTGNTTMVLPIDSTLILGYLDELAVDFVTVGTMGTVTFVGFYHD